MRALTVERHTRHKLGYLISVALLTSVSVFAGSPSKNLSPDKDAATASVSQSDSSLVTNSGPKWGGFRIRPMALLDYIYGGELEFFLSPRLSVGPTFHFRESTAAQQDLQLFLMNYGLRVMSTLGDTRADREGWYAAFTITFTDVRVRATAQRDELTMWGGSLYVGYQWGLDRIDPRLSVRLGAGLGYKQAEPGHDDLVGNNYPTIANERSDPSLDFTLGFAI